MKDYYLFLFYTETDGELQMRQLPPEDIKELIERHRLGVCDYAIVKGIVMKSFDNKQVPLVLR